MKDANKSSTKKTKKNKNQELEKDLSEKLHIFFSGLGHDVEDIGAELKKTSKLFAKKLSKKLDKVKSKLGEKLHSANVKVGKSLASAKNEVSKDSLVIKQGIQKIAKETKAKTVQKTAVVKKALNKKPAKPAVAVTKTTAPQKVISKTPIKATVTKPKSGESKKLAEPTTMTKATPSKATPKDTITN